MNRYVWTALIQSTVLGLLQEHIFNLHLGVSANLAENGTLIMNLLSALSGDRGANP